MEATKLSSLKSFVGSSFGNYQLVRPIDTGGFATVYLGIHNELHTKAAIKVLHTRMGFDEIEMFRLEARTAARLVHPNIIRVFDFGYEQHIPFLVMDYAPHGNIRQLCPVGSHLPQGIIVSYVRQIAGALQYMHNYGFVHRDIKPQNMLLGRDERILLGDFGITIAASLNATRLQKNIGTLPYMSPESLVGNTCFTSDQYSLAIVVYEWLCGETPFKGTAYQIMRQHLYATPPPLHAKMPTISPAVEKVVLKALAKRPEERFANIQAFAQSLEAAYKGAFFVSFPLPANIPEHTSQPVEKLCPSPLVLPQQKKRGNLWKEMTQVFANMLLVGCGMLGLLTALGIPLQQSWFMCLLGMSILPLLIALCTGSIKAFVYTGSIALFAAAWGVGFQSQQIFAWVYILLLVPSILVALSMSITRGSP